MSDWRKECAVLKGIQDYEYASDYKLYMAGRKGMRAAGVIAMAKVIPHYRVVVVDLATLDMLVSRGAKPSQIILSGELESGYSVDTVSIDGVEVEP